jgi:hypothetical protein
MDRVRYGTPALARILNVVTPGGEHVGYMVLRPHPLPPVGMFSTIGEAEAQAEADRHQERVHNRETGEAAFYAISREEV